MKKLYEYVIDIQLDYQFIKRISINEQTKTVWFELIVLDKINKYEHSLLKNKNDLGFEETNEEIKDFLLCKINTEFISLIYCLGLDQKLMDNSGRIGDAFMVNGKEILLKDNKYAELKKKVLKAVKQYGLH